MRYIISDAAKNIEVEPHVLRYWEEELAVEIPRNEMGHRYYRDKDIKLMQGVKLLKERGFQLKTIRVLLPEIGQVISMDERKLLELRDRLELAISQEELRQQREAELEKRCGTALGEKAFSGENIPEAEAAKETTVNGWMKEGPVAVKVMEESIHKVVSLPKRRELAKAQVQSGIEATQDATQTVMNAPEEAVEAGGLHVVPQLSREEQKPELCPEEKIIRFRALMGEIVKEAVKENNMALTETISKEMEYQLRRKELLEEERYKRLDRTIREYQQGQKQVAVTREAEKKRESKFFKKHKVRI